MGHPVFICCLGHDNIRSNRLIQTESLKQVVSSGSVGPVVDALAHVSSNRSEFSAAAVEEIMRQYNNVSSGEMRNLSTALLELLVRNLAVSCTARVGRVNFTVFPYVLCYMNFPCTCTLMNRKTA